MAGKKKEKHTESRAETWCKALGIPYPSWFLSIPERRRRFVEQQVSEKLSETPAESKRSDKREEECLREEVKKAKHGERAAVRESQESLYGPPPEPDESPMPRSIMRELVPLSQEETEYTQWCQSVYSGYRNEVLAGRVVDTEDDARRGRKVLLAASEGGRVRAKSRKERERRAREELATLLRRQNACSAPLGITSARKHIAKKLGYGYTSVLRYTTGMKCPPANESGATARH